MVLWVFAFLTRGSSVALLLLVARLVLGEEFVLVVPQVGCVDDLVEVFLGLFLALLKIRRGSVVSKMVCGTVSGVDHKSGFEQVLLAREVGGEGPCMNRVSVIVVELHPCGSPFSSYSAPGEMFN